MNAKPRQQGFTLVETLVALTILAIALVGTWKLNLAVLHNDMSSHKKATATQLADKKLEELKASPFAALALGQQTDFCTRDGDRCTSTSDGQWFRRDWVVSNAPIAVPDTLQMAVRVGWGGKTCSADLTSCDHLVELVTFVTNI